MQRQGQRTVARVNDSALCCLTPSPIHQRCARGSQHCHAHLKGKVRRRVVPLWLSIYPPRTRRRPPRPAARQGGPACRAGRKLRRRIQNWSWPSLHGHSAMEINQGRESAATVADQQRQHERADCACAWQPDLRCTADRLSAPSHPDIGPKRTAGTTQRRRWLQICPWRRECSRWIQPQRIDLQSHTQRMRSEHAKCAQTRTCRILNERRQ